MSNNRNVPKIKPYEAQKALDAVNRFNTTSADDPDRETSANVALIALEAGVLTEQAAISFNIDLDSLKENRNGKGLDLHEITRNGLMQHISRIAIEHGAIEPRQDAPSSDDTVEDDMGSFEPAFNS